MTFLHAMFIKCLSPIINLQTHKAKILACGGGESGLFSMMVLFLLTSWHRKHLANLNPNVTNFKVTTIFEKIVTIVPKV